MKTMSQKSSNHWKSLFIKVPIIGTYFLLAACSVPETSVRPPVAVENPAPAKQIPVLCLAAHDLVKQGLDHLDPKAVEAYRAAGFDLHFGFYEETTAEKLAGYPLVVGMMPMREAHAPRTQARCATATHSRLGSPPRRARSRCRY